MKKIGFHSNQLSLRGTEVSLFNYAKYNQTILSNKSIIFTFPNTELSGIEKFKKHFEVIILERENYESFFINNHFDFLYTTKAGFNDGFFLKNTPTIVHTVFAHNEPHGYKYLYISDWLAKSQGYDPETHSLPYICEKLPNSEYNLKNKLGLNEKITTFGCYGGYDQFDITWVKEAIINTVNNRKDIQFMFMNIEKFVDHEQVIFLPGTYDLKEKSAFVNSCDAMIHARSMGESFGLAISEFALENKPIITYFNSNDRNHIEVLGERGIYYTNYDEIFNILNNFNKYIKYDDYYRPYLKFNPFNIMEKFNKFI